jgi:hypothetical protein
MQERKKDDEVEEYNFSTMRRFVKQTINQKRRNDK